MKKETNEAQAKEYLTVQEAAKLLNSSNRMIYSLIKQGNIKAVNLAERKTLIRRSDIDKLFDQPTKA
jgi:excisionase family DNA binding protein